MRAVAYCSHDPLEAVRRPDADAVALLDAARQQPARRAGRSVPRAPDTSRDSPGDGDDERLAVAARSTVRRRFSPIVSPSSGTSLTPCAYEAAVIVITPVRRVYRTIGLIATWTTNYGVFDEIHDIPGLFNCQSAAYFASAFA